MKKYECRILTIHAYHQTENKGDEIFLKRNKRKIWPENARYKKIKATSARIHHTIGMNELGERLELELWEYDHFMKSHIIGKFILTANETGGPYTTDLTQESGMFAKYSLEWEVNRKRLL